MLLRSLARTNDITLLALTWNDDDWQALEACRQDGIQVFGVNHRTARRTRALIGDPRRPLQQIVSSSAPFAREIRNLIRDAWLEGRPYHAVHVEHFRGAAAVDLFSPLGAPVLYDAVDCLAELARLSRRHGPNPFVRGVARLEEARTRAAERKLLDCVDVVTVVAERDRQAMVGPGCAIPVHVVPNGSPVRPAPVSLTSEPRACFTGKLSYHANQAAARVLIEEIWPRVRAEVPSAELVIAGADPPVWLLKSQRDGVRVVANPVDMTPIIEQSRVSLAPVVYSVGIQNKVLEAMATGVPVVASETAASGLLPEGREHVAMTTSNAEFVDQTVRVLTDDDRARRLGTGGYDYAKTYHSWEQVAARMESLYRMAGSGVEAASA